MKEHEILVDGTSYKVKIKEYTVGAPFLVRINEKDVEGEISGKPAGKTPFTATIKGKSYRVELKTIDRRLPFQVRINQIPFTVQFKVAERKITRIPTSSAVALAPRPSRKIAGEGEVLAPMAGKIVSVKVKEGDRVNLGDVLCTLEAMKMENEIAATKSGEVEQVRIIEGTAVNEGDLLIKIR